MSEKSMALVPINEQEVLFYDDALVAVLVSVKKDEPPQVYVPVKPISDALGMAWSGQYERLQRDEVLAEVSQLIRVTRINSQRGNPDSLCLPIEFIPGWLFGISASRVKPEMRNKIMRYRRECYKVLAEAFQEGRLTADPILDELLQTNTDAVQAYKMLQAMVKLARNQVLLEAKVDAYGTQLSDHEYRLEEIESTLGDTGRNVTPDQASQISQAVKVVAIALGKQTKRNEFGAVYGEMYRKFGVTSYKLLPVNKFEEAMAWLSDWHGQLTDDAPF